MARQVSRGFDAGALQEMARQVSRGFDAGALQEMARCITAEVEPALPQSDALVVADMIAGLVVLTIVLGCVVPLLATLVLAGVADAAQALVFYLTVLDAIAGQYPALNGALITFGVAQAFANLAADE